MQFIFESKFNLEVLKKYLLQIFSGLNGQNKVYSWSDFKTCLPILEYCQLNLGMPSSDKINKSPYNILFEARKLIITKLEIINLPISKLNPTNNSIDNEILFVLQNLIFLSIFSTDFNNFQILFENANKTENFLDKEYLYKYLWLISDMLLQWSQTIPNFEHKKSEVSLKIKSLEIQLLEKNETIEHLEKLEQHLTSENQNLTFEFNKLKNVNLKMGFDFKNMEILNSEIIKNNYHLEDQLNKLNLEFEAVLLKIKDLQSDLNSYKELNQMYEAWMAQIANDKDILETKLKQHELEFKIRQNVSTLFEKIESFLNQREWSEIKVSKLAIDSSLINNQFNIKNSSPQIHDYQNCGKTFEKSQHLISTHAFENLDGLLSNKKTKLRLQNNIQFVKLAILLAEENRELLRICYDLNASN